LQWDLVQRNVEGSRRAPTMADEAEASIRFSIGSGTSDTELEEAVNLIENTLQPFLCRNVIALASR
jgi:hypothetical protein